LYPGRTDAAAQGDLARRVTKARDPEMNQTKKGNQWWFLIVFAAQHKSPVRGSDMHPPAQLLLHSRKEGDVITRAH
jgi:hypothetical protein